MRITFKLFASLGDYLPPQVRPGNVMTLDVGPTDSIATIIAPEDRATRTLQEGDALAIWPPIAGG